MHSDIASWSKLGFQGWIEWWKDIHAANFSSLAKLGCPACFILYPKRHCCTSSVYQGDAVWVLESKSGANSGGNSSSNSVRVPKMFGPGFATRMAFLHENIQLQPKNCLEDAEFLQLFRVVSSDGGPRQWMLWLTSQRAKWMSDVWKRWWCFRVCWSFSTWNQICQICCMLHVRIHVKLVVRSKSCQWSIPWLVPGLSCWIHKGAFCISCNVSKHVQTSILCAFHGRHTYFNRHFNTKWSVLRCDGQACFKGSSKRSSSLVVWCLKAVWCWLSVGSSSMLFNQFIHCFTWSSHTVSGRQVFMVFFAPLSLDLENHAKRCSSSFICKPIGWYQLIFGDTARAILGKCAWLW